MCVWKWQAIDIEEMKDFDGLLSFLYGFLVLCSSSFSFVEFVQSSSVVFFETISQLPSLTVSEFYFFVQLGRPPFIWVQICREAGLWVWLFLLSIDCVWLFFFFSSSGSYVVSGWISSIGSGGLLPWSSRSKRLLLELR
jgi:hypothetical protein